MNMDRNKVKILGGRLDLGTNHRPPASELVPGTDYAIKTDPQLPSSLQDHVKAVSDTRQRFEAAKTAHDELMARIKTEHAAVFDEFEKAKEAKSSAESKAREAIEATEYAAVPVTLPDGFGLRKYVKYQLTDEFRGWALVNMPALMMVDTKRAQAVLKTGLFEEAPAHKIETSTATISKKLVKGENGNSTGN